MNKCCNVRLLRKDQAKRRKAADRQRMQRTTASHMMRERDCQFIMSRRQIEPPGFSESMVAHERQMISRGVLLGMRLQKEEIKTSHGVRCTGRGDYLFCLGSRAPRVRDDVDVGHKLMIVERSAAR